jgi:hypothetical protein
MYVVENCLHYASSIFYNCMNDKSNDCSEHVMSETSRVSCEKPKLPFLSKYFDNTHPKVPATRGKRLYYKSIKVQIKTSMKS